MSLKIDRKNPNAFNGISTDLAKKSRSMQIDAHKIAKHAKMAGADLADIERQISLICEQRSNAIYNNLIDSYPIPNVGIRDCYRKSM